MTLETESEWVCPDCGAENVATMWQTVNARVSPKLALHVQDGSLFLIKCSHCGHTGRFNYSTQYHDMANKRYCIYTSPDNPPSQHTREFMESIAIEHWNDYHLRCVDDLDSLIELACIWRDGLDDAVLLCYRLMLMVEIERAYGAMPSILRYVGKADEKEGTSLEFFVVLDDEARVTMNTSDALYTVVSSRVEQSKPTIFPTGKWIDWTSATAMQALRSE